MQKDAYLALLPRIRDLFKRAFGREVPETLLIWKFLDHPSRETRITTLAEGDRLVCHYASLPADLRWKGKTYKAGISGTVMTDPACGGRGLFQETGKRQYAMLGENGYDLGFTFTSPDRITDAIFLGKMGWAPLYEIPTLTLNLSGKELPAGAAEGEDDPGFERFDYATLDDRHGLIHVPRTPEYLRWRYARHPKNRYTNIVLPGADRAPRAYAILKPFGSGASKAMDMVDYYAPDTAALDRLMLAVARRAKAEAAAAINTWSPRHHFSHHRLMAFGFRHALPPTYAAYRPFREGLDPALGWYNNWWLMMGDSDVY